MTKAFHQQNIFQNLCVYLTHQYYMLLNRQDERNRYFSYNFYKYNLLFTIEVSFSLRHANPQDLSFLSYFFA